jgi:plastocyanin
MHLATLQLAPILAAEKSRVPFYIAGGVLVAWALIVSIGIGMRRPDFPGSQSGERLLIAVSVVLVIATASTAVLTAGTPAKAATTQSPAGTESQPAPAPSASGASSPAAAPKATTGTPAPPSSPAGRQVTTSLKLAANPEGNLSYNTKTLSAKPGTVTITMENMSPVEHNVTVASGTTVLGATPTFAGGARTITLKLKPGTYTFYCSVPGHRQAGMEGTLTVSS